MSVSTIALIRKRIEGTSANSKIAVFKTTTNKLDAVFESTVETKNKIKNNDKNLIGVFCIDNIKVFNFLMRDR